MARGKDAGRGWLSAWDKLPKECGPIVEWAKDQLRDRDKTQTEIYEEFYLKMEALRKEYRGELDFDIPSFTAFNRQSIKLAALTRRLDDARMIYAALAVDYDPKSSDDLTIIAAEAIKTLVFEVTLATGEAGIDPKGAKELANALYAAAKAQSVSSARRTKVEKDFADGVAKAVDTVAKLKGLTAETAEAIKEMVLGIASPAKAKEGQA